MATLTRQISYYTSILLWPKNYYWREQTAGISDGNKKVSRRIWKWLSVCAAEIHREIDESLVVLNTFLFQIKRVSLFWPKKISFRTKLTFDFFNAVQLFYNIFYLFCPWKSLRIIMHEKCGRPDSNEFQLKWRFGTHGNWKNQNPGGRFGATS